MLHAFASHLPTIGAALARIPEPTFANDVAILHALGSEFGSHAIPMLELVATQSQQFELRLEAASQLLALQQPSGAPVIAKARHSGDWIEHRYALAMLDRLTTRHVSIFPFANDCTGGAPDDPCRARDITPPPGKCKPHFPCVPPRPTASPSAR